MRRTIFRPSALGLRCVRPACLGVLTLVLTVSAGLAVGTPPPVHPIHADTPPTYTVTDLGTFPGGSYSYANGINAGGQVIGYSEVPGGDEHAFRTTATGGIDAASDLGTLPGGSYSYANGINASGQVVGFGDFDNSYTHAFRTTATGGIDAASDLGTLPGGSYSSAKGINASGQLVGDFSQSSNYTHAFRTMATGRIDAASDLGILPGGSYSYATGINASGQVVGVGDFGTSGSGYTHAFRTTATGGIDAASDLGTLPGDSSSAANGVNASGQVVGVSYSGTSGGDQHAFLYDDSAMPHMRDLNSLIPSGSGVTLTDAGGINDLGQIAATGTINGQTHAFRLTPVGLVCTPTGCTAVKRVVDLKYQDTDTEHDTTTYATLDDPSPPISAQIFNSPVGYPDAAGWETRDTTLQPVAGSDAIGPASVPFGARIAPVADNPSLLALTNEEGVSLTIGLSSVDGMSPSPAHGAVSGSTITYPSPGGPSSSDLSLRATISGIEVGLIAPNASTTGSATFTVVPQGDVALEQDSVGGVITATRTTTTTTSEGLDVAGSDAEYVIESPFAVDGASVVGPVSMALGHGLGGQQTIAIAVDSAWLHAPGRVFPVRIDLPVVTAGAGDETGLAGSVNSCTPMTPAVPDDVVVGVNGVCTYHGVEYFDVTSLPSDAMLLSATLHAYSPGHTGPTGVSVYPNAATLDGETPAAWQPPTWNTAPSLQPGASGIGQSGSDGHWQSWDVTHLVQGWLDDPSSNNGMTLIGSDAPVRFASPVGAGSGTPDTAPYLTVVYQPAGTNASATSPASRALRATPRPPAGALHDGVAHIYGVAGTFADDNTYPSTCTARHLPGCGGVLQVKYLHTLGASYMRTGIKLECTSSPDAAPHPGWWDTHGDNDNYAYTGPDSLKAIVSRAASYNIIPIILIDAHTSCYRNETGTTWRIQMRSLVDSLATYYPKDKWIDFEIGNEMNSPKFVSPGPDARPCGRGHLCADVFRGQYSQDFASAAQGLEEELHHKGYSHYVIMTGGVQRPSASGTVKCEYPSGDRNIQLIQAAIRTAELPAYAVPHVTTVQHLAVAVHPYEYMTDKPSEWRNSVFYNNRFDRSGCFDLRAMLNYWTSRREFHNLPLFMTEINWDGILKPSDTNSQKDDLLGAYLADLFTWLRHQPEYHVAQRDTSQSRLRVVWFDGADFGPYRPDPQSNALTLGIYGNGQQGVFLPGGDKTVHIPRGTVHIGRSRVPYCTNPLVRGAKSMANDYKNLLSHGCY